MAKVSVIQSHNPDASDIASAEFTRILFDTVNLYEERLASMEDVIAGLELQRCGNCIAAARVPNG